MKEIDFGRKIDRYLRLDDTPFAKGLLFICPLRSEGYLKSIRKIFFGSVITLPLAIGASPIIAGLAFLAKLEDKGPSFYVQKRNGTIGRPIELIKIRTMIKDAEKLAKEMMSEIVSSKPEDDPRNTKLGKLIRPSELDELPQLWQVAIGYMTLVGIRPQTAESHDTMKESGSIKYENWKKEVPLSPPGLYHLNALNLRRKDPTKRFHYDLFYIRHASLGFDLYIFVRNNARLLKKLFGKKHREQKIPVTGLQTE